MKIEYKKFLSSLEEEKRQKLQKEIENEIVEDLNSSVPEWDKSVNELTQLYDRVHL